MSSEGKEQNLTSESGGSNEEKENGKDHGEDKRDKMDGGDFDYLVIGTGLSESILTRLLSDPSGSNSTVLHIDPNNRYGQSWTSLNLDQLRSSGPSLKNSTLKDYDEDFEDEEGEEEEFRTEKRRKRLNSSDYLLSLRPALVPARGKFVDLIISSNVSPYLSFQLLNRFILYREDEEEDGGKRFLDLPGSKHDLFMMKGLSLIDKRLLMRFFKSVIDSDLVPDDNDFQSPSKPQLDPNLSLKDYLTRPPFSISNLNLISMISALSLSPTSDPTAKSSIDRLKTILRSIGRHQPTHSSSSSVLPSALLIGEYGGGGEWVEGFVRSAAVTGNSVQVLGRQILSLNFSSMDDGDEKVWKIRLGDQKDQTGSSNSEEELEFRAKKVFVSEDYLPRVFPGKSSSWSFDGSRRPIFQILRGIIIVESTSLDGRILRDEGSEDDNDKFNQGHTLIVFPSKRSENGEERGGGWRRNPVQALVIGSQSGCCPIDKKIIYLSKTIESEKEGEGDEEETLEPEKILRPFLDKLLTKRRPSVTTPAEPSEVKNADHESGIRFSLFYSQPIFSNETDDGDGDESLKVVPDWTKDIERSTLIEIVEGLTETIESYLPP